VKTTPKPRATKKRSGELGPFLLPSSVGVAVGPEVVAEGKSELVEVAILIEDPVGDLCCGCDDQSETATLSDLSTRA
jgi:hypothetical protein